MPEKWLNSFVMPHVQAHYPVTTFVCNYEGEGEG